MPLPIEDYAAIGDGHTAALIGIDGSARLALPAPVRLPGLLRRAARRRGERALAAGPRASTPPSVATSTTPPSWRRRTPPTTGEVRVTDLMPTGDRRADVVRRVEGVRGTVSMRHSWIVRFDYGRIRPWVHREEVEGEPAIIATAGPDKLILTGPAPPTRRRRPPRGDLRRPGRRPARLHADLGPVLPDVPDAVDIDTQLAYTLEEQQKWADACEYDGPWRRQVVRSLVTLRGLTHIDTGGIVAAPTTSLPEDFGGERNWDYRYCWLRDAALTLESLLAAGRADDAHHWRDWLLRAIAGDPVGHAGDVHRRGRSPPARARARPPGRLPGLAAGARRQRCRRPAPDRRARRGDVRAVHGPQQRGHRDPRQLEPAAHPGQRTRRAAGSGPTTASGRSAASSGASPTAG